MTWHVEREVLGEYQKGSTDRIAAASVEMHVTGCEQCRSMLSPDAEWLEGSWMSVAQKVEPSPPGLLERAFVALGLRPNSARLVAVSPALRLSFLLALVLVMVFAVGASRSNPRGDSYRVFLIVAPLLPVAGVAFAYGRLVDPAYELTVTAPIDSLRLLLLRAATVLSVSIVLGVAAWPFIDTPDFLGITAWLLPSLALTLVTLSLASRFELWMAAAITAAGWGLALLAAMAEEVEVFGGWAQLAHVVVAAVAVFAIVMRRNSYDREGGHR